MYRYGWSQRSVVNFSETVACVGTDRSKSIKSNEATGARGRPPLGLGNPPSSTIRDWVRHVLEGIGGCSGYFNMGDAAGLSYSYHNDF